MTWFQNLDDFTQKQDTVFEFCLNFTKTFDLIVWKSYGNLELNFECLPFSKRYFHKKQFQTF